MWKDEEVLGGKEEVADHHVKNLTSYKESQNGKEETGF